MTTPPNPKEEIAREISSLQSKLSSLEKSARLSVIRDSVEDLQTAVGNLGQDISKLRSRGYVFGKSFEASAVNFASQWTRLAPDILAQVNQQAGRLQTALSPIRAKMNTLAANAGNIMQAQMLIRQLKAETDALDSQVDAAEGQVKGMYDSFQSQVNKLKEQLKRIDWTLTQLAESTFPLLATEAAVMAVPAVLVKGAKEEKEDPDGVLYLTDQRIIFEQKEQVATKKVLFITTASQKMQKVLFDAPVGLVETIKTSSQGFFKNEDHIEIGFGVGAPASTIHFHIWQDCEEWQALINRAKSKDFDQERTVAVDAAAEAKVKSAPSQCPSCGGNLPQVILRGQDTIKCEFCGFVIRL